MYFFLIVNIVQSYCRKCVVRVLYKEVGKIYCSKAAPLASWEVSFRCASYQTMHFHLSWPFLIYFILIYIIPLILYCPTRSSHMSMTQELSKYHLVCEAVLKSHPQR